MRLSEEQMREIGYQVVDTIVDRFVRMQAGEGPAARVVSGEELARKLSEPMPETGRPVAEAMARLDNDVWPNMVQLAHPRFFAFIPSPGNFIGAMADALAAAYNPFVGTWLGGSGPSALERVTIDWLRTMCELPETAGGLFTSGGSMANLTCLAVARHRTIGDRLDGCAVYLATEAHYSVERALRVLGFRDEHVRVIPVRNYAMDVDALAERMRADRDAGVRPAIVIATTGTTSVGAVDAIDAIADICARESAWLHIDGAYGAAAMISPRIRKELAAVGRADSVSIDPHKWLFQPIEIGCALVRDAEAMTETFRVAPDYLKDVHALGEVNFADMGVQLTRGFRALKLWLSLQVFGAHAFAEAVESGIALAELAQREIVDRERWELLTPASLAIVSFRYRDSTWSEEQINTINEALVVALREDGFAMMSSTLLDGRTALRLCTINPSTTDGDVVATLDRLESLAVHVELQG